MSKEHEDTLEDVTETINNINNFVNNANRYSYIEIARKFFMVLAMFFMIAGCVYTLQLLGLISQQLIDLREQIHNNSGDAFGDLLRKTTLIKC